MNSEQQANDLLLTFDKVEREIALITMNRPERLNAINLDMVEAFEELFLRLSSDQEIRVVILTGSGRGFCSGADLIFAAEQASKGAFTTPYEYLRHAQERYSNLILGLRRIPQPIIAAVNGPAAGGGLALALGSDIRIASPEAFFVASFINVGLSAGEMGTSYLLPRLVGVSRSAEILYTGRKVHSDEAKEIGLVSRVVPKEELINESMSIAKVMLGKSHGGLILTKRVLDSNANAPSLKSAIELEDRNQTLLVTSGDFMKSVISFGK